MAIDRNAARAFTARWAGHGYEKGEAQKFWLDLLEHVLGYKQTESVLFEHPVDSGGFIDVWIADAGVMVEQKSLGVDLDKPEPRQGVMKTPLKQVMDYAEELPLNQRPRFLVTCNFSRFRVYDANRGGRAVLSKAPDFEFTLEEFGEHPEYLGFIVDSKNSRLEKEKDVSIQAGGLIGRLYEMFEACYGDENGQPQIDDDIRHALNVLCVRLVFCLYCEDAGLFEKDGFYRYLKEAAPGDIRYRLQRLFKALDTPLDQRDPFDESLRNFPYVNGGLFTDETEIPPFTPEMKDLLLNEISGPVDWSQISPTIFGGIFESTLNPETRSQGGMHYTSPENIHKVIDPLFLDDLKAELAAVEETPGLTPRQKTNRYKDFHHKLCSLKFLDPASGSGNFLTETYLQLRHLENQVLFKLQSGQAAMALGEDQATGQRVSLSQFYGIEINEFAVKVAEAALWISRLKANGEPGMISADNNKHDFPLLEHANITCANALSLDWNQVLPAGQCTYVLGNPPFIGARNQVKAQKAELQAVFHHAKNSGNIDYVACWYLKAAEYMQLNPGVRTAFVSTNSICQGEQVANMWNPITDLGVHIDFAHTTFRWKNEASDQAHVFVIIVGFSCQNLPKKLYVHAEPDAEAIEVEAKNINAYLVDGPEVFVWNRNTPLCDVPTMGIGNKPIDGGNYLFKPEEMAEFLEQEPQAEPYFHPWMGAKEFIRGEQRYVLWLGDVPPAELLRLPLCRERMSRVQVFRQASKSKPTQKIAQTPARFHVENIPGVDSIFVPRVSSERRDYVPMGFIDSSVFASDSALIIPGGGLYHLGVLMSRVHNAWLRRVGGRLKGDYRYSAGVVYNTFVWPEVTPGQREAIEATAQGILDVRAGYPEAALAELYDPGKMPDDLKAAHERNNHAVAKAYGVSPKTANLGRFLTASHSDCADMRLTPRGAAYQLSPEASETEIVTHLFHLYARATAKT
ncbi:class I SAM-dependent DNA methyltransferase [Mobiluncus mulieris]|uniref:site-specific DNA-methyltransferase (adenine-specific) n=2 Tax=Mobiluncus mulieris TaxID=2052 RepID=A0A7Y0USR9_9ACTO|nr:class I SAM-dependent DNA methyltransferase [Mobiluncus mulieris]NMX03065.1 class I SAM-dependent DNA methyltransferase [Mobiluncus mulieris]NMX10956.1 class I SAM-dependent DNA methyltransferase [Mobiluncus mulieris]